MAAADKSNIAPLPVVESFMRYFTTELDRELVGEDDEMIAFCRKISLAALRRTVVKCESDPK